MSLNSGSEMTNPWKAYMKYPHYMLQDKSENGEQMDGIKQGSVDVKEECSEHEDDNDLEEEQYQPPNHVLHHSPSLM